MYRDDDAARTVRATALIDEIAELERQKVAAAELDHRLDVARSELLALQSRPPPAAARAPGLVTHVMVFAATAAAAAIAYTIAF